MDLRNIKDTRRQLSNECENLIKSINRNRLAAGKIKLENTEYEGAPRSATTENFCITCTKAISSD